MRDGVFLVTERGDPTWLEARTRRALGAPDESVRVVDASELSSALDECARAFVVRVGAYGFELRAPPPSATGKSLVALGAAHDDPAWVALLRATGGVVTRATVLPPTHVAYTEDPRAFAEAWSLAPTIEGAAARLASSDSHRVLRIAHLDAARSARLRVLQVVTSLHRGGAERVALDLASGLRAHDIEAHWGVLDAPRRAAYDAPAGAWLLYDEARTRAERIARTSARAVREGMDLVHAHLLDRAELRALRAARVPLVTTLHNARRGLPAGVAALGPDDADLVLACSRGVLADVPELATPPRVVWNGIALPPLQRAEARAEIRRELGIADDEVLLLAVANPRAQKRLDRSVRTLAELRRRGLPAHLVVAGAPLVISEDAARAQEAMLDAARETAVEAWFHPLGSRDDVARLYAAADVLLSTSEWEGLSLVHLEALVAGVRLVATRVHGTDEIARKHDGVALVDVDAAVGEVADAVESALARPRARALAPDFSLRTMIARHAALLPRVVAPAPRRDGPVLIVTNNLSTGGAQTSARRLLGEIHARGAAAACVVVEEQPEFPTPGREALARAGIPVFATPSLRATPTDVVAAEVLRIVDRERPRAVFFWNLVAELRVVLAEALLKTRVFDVSPGEMSYASLDRYLTAPRVGHPVLDERDYGRLLAGVVAKYEGERERAARLGAPVHVIHNGVPVPAVLPPLPPPRERLVIGTLARLAPNKKLEELLGALERMRTATNRIEVRIAGGGEVGGEAYVAALHARAATLPRGIPVRFVGDVAADAFLSDIDVFAMISEPAGCPNAILEAMAAGRPVVATDVGGARDLVEHGATGLVVPRADPSALAEALSLVATDEELRARLGAAGHARARARFSVERMVDEYLRLVD